jgi:hypothetical protein
MITMNDNIPSIGHVSTHPTCNAHVTLTNTGVTILACIMEYPAHCESFIIVKLGTYDHISGYGGTSRSFSLFNIHIFLDVHAFRL